MMIPHVCSNKGHERHPEQQGVIRPEQASVDAPSRVQKVMMIHPHNGDHEKAHNVAEKLGNKAAQPSERSVARSLQLQHHDCNDHGDDPVTESFEAVGTHGQEGARISIKSILTSGASELFPS